MRKVDCGCINGKILIYFISVDSISEAAFPLPSKLIVPEGREEKVQNLLTKAVDSPTISSQSCLCAALQARDRLAAQERDNNKYAPIRSGFRESLWNTRPVFRFIYSTKTKHSFQFNSSKRKDFHTIYPPNSHLNLRRP